MRVIKAEYGKLKLHIEAAGIWFTLAFLFLNAGIWMLTENIWMYIFDQTVEILLQKERSYTNEAIGLGFLLIGFGFLFAGFRSWRVKIYGELYEQLNETINKFYSTLHLRQAGFDKAIWLEHYQKVYNLYFTSTSYLDKQKIYIDKKIWKEARSILYAIAEENNAFRGTITQTERLFAGDITHDHYDWKKDFKYSKDQADDIHERYKIVEEQLRKKQFWKIS